MSLMDLAGRTVVDDMHSESSSAVDIDGGDADMRSSAAEQQQQEQQQQQGDATADATAGRETAGDAPEEMVRIRTLKRVRYEITLDEIECVTLSAVWIIASSNYSNTGKLYVVCTCMCCCCNLWRNLCI